MDDNLKLVDKMKEKTFLRIILILFIIGVTMLVTGIISGNLLLMPTGSLAIGISVGYKIGYELVVLFEEERRIMRCFND